MSLEPEKLLPRILVCDPIHEECLDKLRDAVNVDVINVQSETELIAILPQYDGLITREDTKITREMIEHAFRLKIIGNATADLANIDVSAALARGIEIVNAPDANTLAVAEHALGLLLAMARRLPWAEAGLRDGTYEQGMFPGTGLAGKTLGIVGFGRIGRQVAIRAQAFGMKILVNDINITPELTLETNVHVVDLDELLIRSDFVSLHVAMTDETERMIGWDQLKLMKPTAYLINTARAALVDEDDLLEALDKRQIAGAALDVMSGEISHDHPMVKHPQVIATPRIGSHTEDAAREAAIAVADQFLDYFQTIVVEPILPLRIVPSEHVFPHELIDEKRVDRLIGRIKEGGILKNPPLVMESESGYMVLDGATRSSAMRKMGLPHMLVQVFAFQAEGLQLNTWFHVIRQMEKSALIALMENLPEVDLIPSDEESVTEEQLEYGSLCTIYFLDGDVFLVQAKSGSNRMKVLNELTSAYIEASLTSRTMNRNLRQLIHEYEDMTALVVFPIYEVEQVMQLAQAGRRVPAGITRFIVPGRILRVNLDLDVLTSESSLREKNRWLQERLLQQSKDGHIRYYAEPVYLLDE